MVSIAQVNSNCMSRIDLVGLVKNPDQQHLPTKVVFWSFRGLPRKLLSLKASGRSYR